MSINRMFKSAIYQYLHFAVRWELVRMTRGRYWTESRSGLAPLSLALGLKETYLSILGT